VATVRYSTALPPEEEEGGMGGGECFSFSFSTGF